MKSHKTNDTFLSHMIQAIQNIRAFTAALTFEHYTTDLVLISAVERQFEILGEAARRLPHDFKDQHPEISWQDIVDLRNVIIHQYDGIDQDIIWKIISSRLPKLEETLINILESRKMDSDR
ncbi:MAG: DUF86 domain-containing protein [Cyanobacteria bacterium J06648_16]